jgi:hypothetical protein
MRRCLLDFFTPPFGFIKTSKYTDTSSRLHHFLYFEKEVQRSVDDHEEYIGGSYPMASSKMNTSMGHLVG